MSRTPNPSLPLVAELSASLSPQEVFLRLAALPHAVFFDSNSRFGRLGRYSFVAADPFDWYVSVSSDRDPLGSVAAKLRTYSTETVKGLPPFQGGLAGLFSYELGRTLEHVPPARITDFPIPYLAVGLYDVVVAYDYVENQAWIISQGFPEMESASRRRRAEYRLQQVQSWLAGRTDSTAVSDSIRIPVSSLAPQFDIGLSKVTSNLSKVDYLRAVERAVEYIYSGDVYQVNFAQRLLSPARGSAVDLYLRLREQNAAPYAGFLNLGEWQICSSSPECFLKVRDGLVETRPIKGTRGRSTNPEADLFAGDELSLSEKDRAENVMIVDLMRNDLSRVCGSSSVHVAELCTVETYAHVKHLVSSVHGRLATGATAIDLLRACFPGGSITGAPKVRAMQIIAELEPTARGAYCGSLAYVGFDGQMDSSILIRTITTGGGWWQLPVGGGIVAQSNPTDEYRETWHKARGLLDALGIC